MDIKSKNPKWEQFEKAIGSFIQALDSNAHVRQNVMLPDVHTNHPRQRDIWIETKILQHYPVKIYVSCKRLQRKINEQDLDAFNGELISSGAHVGVLYSFSGFTKPALEKANKLGISCCKLYVNDKPDLPESLIFYSYCCTPKVLIKVIESPEPEWNIATYNDLFNLELEMDAKKMLFLDYIDSKFRENEKNSANSIEKERLPSDWSYELKISTTESFRRPIRILIGGSWNIYKGKIEANLLNGSYSFSTGQFIGSQSTPWIDTRGPHPGPGWELLERRPNYIESSLVTAILYGGSIKELLTKNLGDTVLSI